MKFTDFLNDWVCENNHHLQLKETSSGEMIISQTQRNQMRKEGMKALKEDLIQIFGDYFDVVETSGGLNIVAEGDPDSDFNETVTWELKCTIKAVSYDPFDEAGKFDDAEEARQLKKEEVSSRKRAEEIRKQEKRERKLRELGLNQ